MKSVAVEAAFFVLLGAGVRAEAGDDGLHATAGEASNVRLNDCRERFAVAKALRAASRRLDEPGCRSLLDELHDESGRPLRDNLTPLGLTMSDFAGSVFFYDAPPGACRPAILALARPGCRVVLVCGALFVRQMKRDSRHAEAVLIHELLHALGLGEDPPASERITQQIRERCGTRAPSSDAVALKPWRAAG